MTRAVCRVLVLLLVPVVPAACSDSNGLPSDHWVWQFVDPPSDDRDFFEELPTVLVFVDHEGNVSPGAQIEFSNALHRITSASRNSGEPKRTVLRITGDRFWHHYESGGQTVEVARLIDVVKAAANVSQNLIEGGDVDRAESLAESLLLFGYQVSRNGEGSLIASVRHASWATALDRLLVLGPGDDPQFRQYIERAQQARRAEMVEIKDRDSNRLYYPFH